LIVVGWFLAERHWRIIGGELRIRGKH